MNHLRDWSRAVLLAMLIVAVQPGASSSAAASSADHPFGLPFNTAPGPSTWLFIQAYGNTVSAYRWRVSQYGAGQSLHFGLDFAARCSPPVVAAGEGVVVEVDNLSHGADPHNLIIQHANRYALRYGHLLKRAHLVACDHVQRGQAIALSGAPDGTCAAGPHLY